MSGISFAEYDEDGEDELHECREACVVDWLSLVTLNAPHLLGLIKFIIG